MKPEEITSLISVLDFVRNTPPAELFDILCQWSLLSKEKTCDCGKVFKTCWTPNWRPSTAPSPFRFLQPFQLDRPHTAGMPSFTASLPSLHFSPLPRRNQQPAPTVSSSLPLIRLRSAVPQVTVGKGPVFSTNEEDADLPSEPLSDPPFVVQARAPLSLSLEARNLHSSLSTPAGLSHTHTQTAPGGRIEEALVSPLTKPLSVGRGQPSEGGIQKGGAFAALRAHAHTASATLRAEREHLHQQQQLKAQAVSEEGGSGPSLGLEKRIQTQKRFGVALDSSSSSMPGMSGGTSLKSKQFGVSVRDQCVSAEGGGGISLSLNTEGVGQGRKRSRSVSAPPSSRLFSPPPKQKSSVPLSLPFREPPPPAISFRSSGAAMPPRNSSDPAGFFLRGVEGEGERETPRLGRESDEAVPGGEEHNISPFQKSEIRKMAKGGESDDLFRKGKKNDASVKETSVAATADMKRLIGGTSGTGSIGKAAGVMRTSGLRSESRKRIVSGQSARGSSVPMGSVVSSSSRNPLPQSPPKASGPSDRLRTKTGRKDESAPSPPIDQKAVSSLSVSPSLRQKATEEDIGVRSVRNPPLSPTRQNGLPFPSDPLPVYPNETPTGPLLAAKENEQTRPTTAASAAPAPSSSSPATPLKRHSRLLPGPGLYLREASAGRGPLESSLVGRARGSGTALRVRVPGAVGLTFPPGHRGESASGVHASSPPQFQRQPLEFSGGGGQLYGDAGGERPSPEPVNGRRHTERDRQRKRQPTSASASVPLAVASAASVRVPYGTGGHFARGRLRAPGLSEREGASEPSSSGQRERGKGGMGRSFSAGRNQGRKSGTGQHRTTSRDAKITAGGGVSPNRVSSQRERLQKPIESGGRSLLAIPSRFALSAADPLSASGSGLEGQRLERVRTSGSRGTLTEAPMFVSRSLQSLPETFPVFSFPN
uniref:Uncharacterized protein n=1 Tax=Chromera velia CCMP2878 TaxID=1169474 RepID=A0A0G4HLI8_9ALVE|eukprot:Cvel_28835.t1-p1 / transcript=Cvel_28835.t1 / gene=Cvel_28835 / organism=Chromera_velia_CCMP2878 / gene_product=hypothetical protein / transcript_product=hypothetical protein / location=Cvel_scaffold3847:10388-13186(-) / protein_length=933 / sequence_SO=supercontig / SO=protein_coding / is_pseudo=false